MKLEELLDKEVESYLCKLRNMEEVQNLLSGNIDRETYIRFLKTFYTIEYLSQRAVNMAALYCEKSNPYLSKRFFKCAQGELGHAEIALKDLKDLGEDFKDASGVPVAEEYDAFLQEQARIFPLAILGHSYLFENVSGIMFPEHKPIGFPSKFVEVHAEEDPKHSAAIKKTVRNIQKDLSSDEMEKVIEFTRKSGDYLLRLFNQY